MGFDTTSRNSNKELVEFVADFLRDHGVAVDLVESAPGKLGLIGQLGPSADGGIVVCGHTDTVPVDGQDWSTDPYVLTTTGDALVGRGVVDMKGFVAAVLSAVPRFAEKDLRRPVTIALTADEEIGCLGADAVAAALRTGPRPLGVVVGEATAMGVAQGHKGVRVIDVEVIGKEVHSSQPQSGANANFGAARIVAAIADLADDLAKAGVQAEDFTPPYTTTNVGRLHGGTALNIVPGRSTLTWEFRVVPGDDAQRIEDRIAEVVTKQVVPALRTTWPQADVVMRRVADVPCLDPAGNVEVADLVERLGRLQRRGPVSYGTDGSILQAAGLPSVVVGPGQIDQMHQPDEALRLDELAACERFLDDLADWLASDATSPDTARG